MFANCQKIKILSLRFHSFVLAIMMCSKCWNMCKYVNQTRMMMMMMMIMEFCSYEFYACPMIPSIMFQSVGHYTTCILYLLLNLQHTTCIYNKVSIVVHVFGYESLHFWCLDVNTPLSPVLTVKLSLVGHGNKTLHKMFGNFLNLLNSQTF